MRKSTPVFIVYISTKTHNHEPLVTARPGSWLDRNGHGADQPGANIEGGGSDVAGTIGGWGDVPGGCLGVAWYGQTAPRVGWISGHGTIPLMVVPVRWENRRRHKTAAPGPYTTRATGGGEAS